MTLLISFLDLEKKVHVHDVAVSFSNSLRIDTDINHTAVTAGDMVHFGGQVTLMVGLDLESETSWCSY